MSDAIPDLRSLPRARAFSEIRAQMDMVLDGISDEIAGMATLSALLHHSLGFLWTGFYRVVQPGKLLRIGPYQGSLGCLEIEIGRGVCGTAARDEKTIVVGDVAKFDGHISCDARSRSEIVVPVFNFHRKLIAVLDIDSEDVDHFDEADKIGLENVVTWFTKA